MNQIIKFLTERQSNPFLVSPAPSNEELSLILKAGMRVPDHAALMPWHFTIVQEDSLSKLSDIFVASIKDKTDDQAKLDKTAKMPFRAPLMIIVSTDYKEHEKVPAVEQLITAGCCVQAMQMAATSLGYGAMWRTGDLAFNDKVKEQLNINKENEIVGFLYVGSKSKELPLKPEKKMDGKVTYL